VRKGGQRCPATIEELPRLDRERFVTLLGGVFEHSPWVAERAYRHGPYGSVDDLHRVMVAVVGAASRAEQLALLRAHPELAGREAREGTLTEASTGEQARAGLSALSPAESRRIATLNTAYRARHGIPFIACVGHYTKAEIFAELERRLANAPEAEIAEALLQVGAIARLRLDAVFSPG
jgi:2-oxo-4-hydroxy-4-carboxy-5-ureidoimidazoline decarboxylase